MVTSVENIFAIVNGSVGSFGDSVGDLAGSGIGSLAATMGPLLDGLATASGAGK